MSALEEFTRTAMAAGFACIGERVARGEVCRDAPLTQALGDFPAEFLKIRSGLVDDLKAEWGVE